MVITLIKYTNFTEPGDYMIVNTLTDVLYEKVTSVKNK